MDDAHFFLKSYVFNLALFLSCRIGAALGARLMGHDGALALGACRHVRFLHGQMGPSTAHFALAVMFYRYAAHSFKIYDARFMMQEYELNTHLFS